LTNRFLVISFIILYTLGTFLFSADEPLCKQVANYTMNVNLDTEKNIITCTELL